MKIRLGSLVLAALALSYTPAGAQPSESGPFGGEHQDFRARRHAYRFERMAQFLELDEAQESQWQTVLEGHLETARLHHERLAVLADEFRALAEDPDPDLTQLGQLALDIHRQRRAAGASREQLIEDLEAVLTREQRERFEALEAAGEAVGPHLGRRVPHGPWTERRETD